MGGGVVAIVQLTVIVELHPHACHTIRSIHDTISFRDGGIFRVDVLYDESGARRLIIHLENVIHEGLLLFSLHIASVIRTADEHLASTECIIGDAFLKGRGECLVIFTGITIISLQTVDKVYCLIVFHPNLTIGDCFTGTAGNVVFVCQSDAPCMAYYIVEIIACHKLSYHLIAAIT